MENLLKRKMKSFLIFSLFIFLAFPGIVHSDNTITSGPGSIEISSIDSDWTAGTNYSIQAFIFIPGAAGDIMVIKSVIDTGPELTRMISSDGESRITYFDGIRLKPMLDFSACTLTAGSKLLILVR